MICEKGLGVSNDCLPAKQSAIFSFSAEDSKTMRMFAHFLRPKGTGDAWIRPPAAYLCSILSIENRAGALPANFQSVPLTHHFEKSQI